MVSFRKIVLSHPKIAQSCCFILFTFDGTQEEKKEEIDVEPQQEPITFPGTYT